MGWSWSWSWKGLSEGDGLVVGWWWGGGGGGGVGGGGWMRGIWRKGRMLMKVFVKPLHIQMCLKYPEFAVAGSGGCRELVKFECVGSWVYGTGCTRVKGRRARLSVP